MRAMRGLLAALALLCTAASAAAEEPILFVRDVWPIFVRDCISCHSVKQRYANLQLDSPARILQGGDIGPAVVPGHPEQSELIRRLQLPADSPDRMPRERKPLTPAELARIERWIAEGAQFGAWVGMGAVARGPQ
ncbi:MAG TPA: c-type cytochrome domain-containing protein [Myxococcota bacterium]|nr:c-type cytochrome domain-containing protein [Myxococcota bacterium]